MSIEYPVGPEMDPDDTQESRQPEGDGDDDDEEEAFEADP